MPVAGRNMRLVGCSIIATIALAFGVWIAWNRHWWLNDSATHVTNTEQSDSGTNRKQRPIEAAQNQTITDESLQRMCGRCHRVPPPDAFPRSAWKSALSHMLASAGIADAQAMGIPLETMIDWFEERAPDQLPRVQNQSTDGTGHFRFNLRKFQWDSQAEYRPGRVRETGASVAGHSDLAAVSGVPGVSNVRFADLVDDERLELIICDMWNGVVLMGRPYEAHGSLELLARVPFPAHAEVQDLDRDGRRDLIVADLGSLMPADHQKGSVVWLRNTSGLGFQPITLQGGLGRVADVQPADFDNDGDIDLVVAEFGWRATGRVLMLENESDSPDRPQFVPHSIDSRHGAIHVPVTDLNGDGRLDFVALFAQEHETVVAFLNRGNLRFEPHELYRAPHPAWGSTGLALVDLDKDGDMDALVTNGDSADVQPKLRPYHSIQWLENSGSLRFVPHELGKMYGVHRADAADLDGDGDLDIVASSFIPLLHSSREQERVEIESIVLLEQTAPGRFSSRCLESQHCDHASLAFGDFDLDGDIDWATGNYEFEQTGQSKPPIWSHVWMNETMRAP